MPNGPQPHERPAVQSQQVRYGNDHVPGRPADAGAFGKRAPIVGDVFERAVANDGVEHIVRKWQATCVGLHVHGAGRALRQ